MRYLVLHLFIPFLLLGIYCNNPSHAKVYFTEQNDNNQGLQFVKNDNNRSSNENNYRLLSTSDTITFIELIASDADSAKQAVSRPLSPKPRIIDIDIHDSASTSHLFDTSINLLLSGLSSDVLSVFCEVVEYTETDSEGSVVYYGENLDGDVSVTMKKTLVYTSNNNNNNNHNNSNLAVQTPHLQDYHLVGVINAGNGDTFTFNTESMELVLARERKPEGEIGGKDEHEHEEEDEDGTNFVPAKQNILNLGRRLLTSKTMGKASDSVYNSSDISMDGLKVNNLTLHRFFRSKQSSLNTARLRSRKLQESHEVKLLVVYTRRAMCEMTYQWNTNNCDVNDENKRNIENLVDVAVAQLNQALTNSGVSNVIFTLAATFIDPSYNEPVVVQQLSLEYSGNDVLTHLTDPDDGQLDGVLEARNAVHADQVVILTSGDTNYCGLAWLDSKPRTAYSLTNRKCVSGHSFSHEIGHNFGCNHNREDSTRVDPYAHGYRDPFSRYRTIMSYNCKWGCSRINYFSTPNRSYGSNIIGTPTEDCARKMSENAPTMASMRQDSCRDVKDWRSSNFQTCDDYASLGICWSYGGCCSNMGYTASSACCLCGGGMEVGTGTPAPITVTASPVPQPTNTPTSSPILSSKKPTQPPTQKPVTIPTKAPLLPLPMPPSSPTLCNDYMGWEVQGNLCSFFNGRPNKCSQEIGNTPGVAGLTANQACCICSTNSSVTSPPSPVAPFPSTPTPPSPVVSPPSPSGFTCTDDTPWNVEGKDCNHFLGRPNKCSLAIGSTPGVSGLSAQQVCCVCASSAPSPPSPSAPTPPPPVPTPPSPIVVPPSPAPASISNNCTDDSSWNVEGKDCNHFLGRPNKCSLAIGSTPGVSGLTAQQVCCVCASLAPSPPSPSTPTPPPPVPTPPVPISPISVVGEFGTLLTVSSGNGTQAGVMFDIMALKQLSIKSMDIHVNAEHPIDIELWTKQGTHVNFERTPTAWSQVHSRTVVMKGVGMRTSTGDFNFISVEAGSIQALYITLVNETTMLFTVGLGSTGSLYGQNNEIALYYGTGKRYPFHRNIENVLFNGYIRYLYV